jgi:hypothetical protein
MFIVRHGGVFFISYLILGVILLILVHGPFNEGFLVSMKWLWAPILILCVAFTKFYFENIRNSTYMSKLKIWTTMLTVYASILFMSWPYVLLLNAVSTDRKTLDLGGVIIEKFVTGSKTNSYVVNTRNVHTNEEKKLQVTKEKYEHLQVGDVQKQCFFIGGLGLPFSWRFAAEQPSCRS